MNKVDISVIIPIYNVPEKNLKQCILSVQKQTFKNIEILLVDDGSSDLSGKICDEFALNDNRIIVIHQENKGLSGARNTGVKNAKGKWFTFIDGDDFIEEACLETAYELAEKKNVDLVMWGTIRDFNGNKLIPYNYDYFVDGKVYEGNEIKHIRELLLHYNTQIATAYSKLIRTELVIENDIYHDEILRQGAEGLEFNIRLFEKIKSLVFIRSHFYHYVYNENSISSLVTDKNTDYVIKCFDKIYEEIDHRDLSMMNWFYNRLKYVIVTTAISGYFHPLNNDSYEVKKKKMKDFLKIDIVNKSLMNRFNKNLSFQRRVILLLLRKRFYFIIAMLAKKRYKDKVK